MLDQLVESKSNVDVDSRRGKYLLTTLAMMVLLFFGVLLASLFGKEYGVGGSDLSLDTFVAPPIIEEQPEPEPEKQPEDKQKDPNVDLREKIIATMEEPPPKVPDKVSSEASKIPPRDPNKYTLQSDRNFSAANAPSSDYKGPVNSSGTGSDSGLDGQGGDDETAGKTTPPPAAPPKPPSRPISGGVLNGKARNLPKPAYPAAARSLRVAGTVTVQVTIDESGNVISASATSGHPLLKAAAVSAARSAKFSPTLLSGQPVKVTGIINYNFAAQ